MTELAPAAGVRPSRLVYLGTPEAAVPPLRALVAAGFEVALVVSRPDKRRGRGGALVPSPVKAAALELGLPVSDQPDDALGAGADLGVVVAYGRLIKPHLLAALPFVNVHFSLLPRWRGAAPVERALLAGDPVTGVCIMQLEEGLDTGPVFARAEVPIGPDQTADELRAELVDVGTKLLVDQLAVGLGQPEPQVGEATYAAKVEPEELHLDWAAPAEVVQRVVRLGDAWTTFRGKRLKVWALTIGSRTDLAPGQVDGLAVGCGSGSVDLVEVQPEGKGRQAAASWRNGARPGPGEHLGV